MKLLDYLQCMIFLQLTGCKIETKAKQTGTSSNGILFPFGDSVNDEVLPREDDDFLKVDLDFKFPFFDENHEELYLNTNGVISFLGEVEEYTPEPFPIEDKRMVAPYWADVDTSVAGDVFYREDTTTQTLDLLNNEIRRAFPVNFRTFEADWVFIATWFEVAFYNNRPTQLEKINNTFQAVLISNGQNSFAIYNFGKIEWTTGLSSFGDKETGQATNDRSIAAQVGFNAGDDENYFAVEGSRTEAVRNVALTSNVDVPGRWIFRIDNREIESAGCQINNSVVELKISPSQVSMLGGDVLSISGPCFESSQDVLCRIDGRVSQARYDFVIDPFNVLCATPVFMKLGSVPVELSLDGGVTYDFMVQITIVPIDSQPDSVDVSGIDSDQTTITFNNTDSSFDILKDSITDVDILLYCYLEDPTRQSVELIPIEILQALVTFSNRQVIIDSLRITNNQDCDSIGMIRIVESGTVNLQTDKFSWSTVSGRTKREAAVMHNMDPMPSLWSKPFSITPNTRQEAVDYCTSWVQMMMANNGYTTAEGVISCPCILDQALADVGRFEPYPRCNMLSDDTENCRYRNDALHCVRSRQPRDPASFDGTVGGRGQLCCYHRDGHLMDMRDSTSGGSVQAHHHLGFLPNFVPGNIPFFSNFLNDVIPWEECCGRSGDPSMCQLYATVRPSSGCTEYEVPRPASVYGDPHFITFDERMYSFNGYGEYHLIEDRARNSFYLQGRFEEIIELSGATAVTAITAQDLGTQSDRVQIEVNQRLTLDVWMSLFNDTVWKRVQFGSGSGIYFSNGVVVKKEIKLADSIQETKLNVTFSNGVSLQVTSDGRHRLINAIIILPPTLKGNIRGLMGTWSDDQDDEFELRSGLYVDGTSLGLHRIFGLKWGVGSNESMFRYGIGDSEERFRTLSQSFPPLYDEAISTLNETQLQSVCGSSQACRFDYHKTESSTLGRVTKTAEDTDSWIRERLKPVLSCGYISPPNSGNKAGSIYTEGAIVEFTCNSELTLKGSQSRQCVDPGLWSGNVTICEPTVAALDLTTVWYILIVFAGCLVIFAFCCILMLISCRNMNKEDEVTEKEFFGNKVVPPPDYPALNENHNSECTYENRIFHEANTDLYMQHIVTNGSAHKERQESGWFGQKEPPPNPIQRRTSVNSAESANNMQGPAADPEPPSTSQPGPSRPPVEIGHDGAPTLKHQPKLRAKENLYADYPGDEDNMEWLYEEFPRNQGDYSSEEEDEIARIKAEIKHDMALGRL